MDGELLWLSSVALIWDYDDLPLKASHFYSPLLIDPPAWAEPAFEVILGDAVQRYFLLDDCMVH
jgi:hypothetical protein